MAHDVFISYSSEDKPTTDAVCATLEEQGIRCWIAPRDILPSQSYGEAIVDAINGAKLMVLVFSSSSNSSPQVLREVERAVSKEIPIVPFRIAEVSPTKSMEYFLSAPHWLDAFTPPIKVHINKLVEIVRKILAATGANNCGNVSQNGIAFSQASSRNETTSESCSAGVGRVSPVNRSAFWVFTLLALVVLCFFLVVKALINDNQSISRAIQPQTSQSEPHNLDPDTTRLIFENESTAGDRSSFARTGGKEPSNPPAGNPSGLPVGGKRVGEIREDNVLAIKLAWMPAASFRMGAPADEAQVDVRITRGFWMGQSELTQGEWTKLMGTAPWQGKEHVKEGPQYPATFVSWEDAVEFCKRLTEQERNSKRLPNGWEYVLPTEAQWEYACRAGTQTRFSFGEDDFALEQYAWFEKNTAKKGEDHAHLVGQKKSNPFGLYDMHGNVCEWCQDFYVKNLIGGDDPLVSSRSSDRVYRGGGWSFSSRNCQSDVRGRNSPDYRGVNLGFRVSLAQSN